MANKIKLAGTTSNTFDVGLDGNGNINAGNLSLTGDANISGNGNITYGLVVGTELDAGTIVVNQNASTVGNPGIRVTGNYTTGGSAGQFQTLSFAGTPGSPTALADNDYTFQIQTLGYTGPSGAYEPIANYGFTGDFALHKTNAITSPVGFNYVGGYFQFVQFGNDGTNDNSYDYQLENGQLRIGGFSPTNGFGPAETNFTVTVQDGTGSQSSYKFGNDGNITLPTNTSSINYANGSPYGGGGANANYANFAGQVVDSTQSNITTLGSLTTLDMAGDIIMNGHQISNSGTIAISTSNSNNFTSFGGTYTTPYGSATSFYRGNGTAGGSMNNITVGDVIKNENYFVYADSGNTYLGVGQTFVDVAYNDGAGNVAIRTNFSAPTVDGVVGKNSIFNVNYANSFFSNVSGNVITANLFSGNGSALTNLNGANISDVANANHANVADTANSVAVANVSGIGNIATVNLDGNSSNVLYGNGVFSSVPTSSYGNSNVATFLASYGSNTITTTGNVSVGNIIGNGQALTGLAGANVSGNVATATLSYTSNLTSVNSNATYYLALASGNGAQQLSIDNTGSIVTYNPFTGNLSTTLLTATTGNVTTINSGLLQNGNANITVALDSTITLNAFGGAKLTATSAGANVTGTITAGNALFTSGANVSTITTAGTTANLYTANATTINIGSASALSNFAGRIGVAGNVTASQLISNVATGTAPFVVTSTTQVANLNVATAGSATTAGTVTTAAQPNITSTGTLTSLSVSGTATIGNLALTKFNETVVASANTSTSISPDLASGSIFAYTANNNFTFNGLTNAVAGSSAIVKITQDGTGNRLLTSTMKFAGGSKTLSTAASSIDIISVYYDGSTYYATLSKGYA